MNQHTPDIDRGLPAEFPWRRALGMLMVLAGASLWGISGTAAQQLFQGEGFTPAWLVAVRMCLSGILLLSMVTMGRGFQAVSSIWHHARDRIRLVIFALAGLAGVQYSYFAAIERGNAATATFLQYLGPAFIIAWIAVHGRRPPSRREQIGLFLAVIGTFLLLTNGHWTTLSVPPVAVVWGIVSAVTLAFYTLYPASLMTTWGSATVVGWAMLLGGAVLACASPPWHIQGQHWDALSASLVGFVVIFGTLVPFYLYLASMKYIAPSETGLVACAEPLSAAIASVVWLHTRLGFTTILGGLLIMGTVAVLARKGRE